MRFNHVNVVTDWWMKNTPGKFISSFSLQTEMMQADEIYQFWGPRSRVFRSASRRSCCSRGSSRV